MGRHSSDESFATLIAHTRNPRGDYHLLREHLDTVAAMAQTSAEAFGAGDLAYWAGMWHDLGKAHPAFQRYLYEAEAHPERTRRGPDHKAAGTCLAVQDRQLHLLAFVINGHHGGLPGAAKLRPLISERCSADDVHQALHFDAQHIVPLTPDDPVALPDFVTTPEQTELLIRMLFSCLVDADFIDTEAHFNPGPNVAPPEPPEITSLWREFERNQEELNQTTEATPVNTVRDEVYRHCLASAGQVPGFFRLTVPTGGGKTRSGLAFALRHAVEHDLRRVIVAIPYTSITEQTASTYRDIFDDPRSVLEHHSAIDPDERDDGTDLDWMRYASQNWNAPIIVTTTVQLFESLFASKPSACRKLHNIARSVIVLDEIQSLPPGVLEPTLDVLRQLVEHYGASVVLSTATQPALDERTGFPGVPDIREVVPDPARLFSVLQRVTFCRPSAQWSWDEVAQEMRESVQAMAIVNTRSDARTLFDALDDPDALHLSTLMCGAHRRQVLREVRRRLAAGENCCLVSTQLVEAGVDLDFPLVLRAIAPLDRIVQAAGRCNREGRLDSGRVIIFEPVEGSLPPQEYRTGTELTQSLFNQGYDDLHAPAIYQHYFEQFYRSVTLDTFNVAAARRELDFPTIADRYRIIDKDTFPVVVPWQADNDDRSADAALAALQSGYGDARGAWRILQHYTVNLSRYQLQEAERRGAVVPVRAGLWQLTPMGTYHRQLGVLLDQIDAGALVF